MQILDHKKRTGTAIPSPQSGHGRPAMDLRRLNRLEDVSRDGHSKLAVFRRAYSSVSLRAAVNAFCLECLWLDPGAIRDCDVVACPLWNVRPYQSRRKGPPIPGSEPSGQ